MALSPSVHLGYAKDTICWALDLTVSLLFFHRSAHLLTLGSLP